MKKIKVRKYQVWTRWNPGREDHFLWRYKLLTNRHGFHPLLYLWRQHVDEKRRVETFLDQYCHLAATCGHAVLTQLYPNETLRRLDPDSFYISRCVSLCLNWCLQVKRSWLSRPPRHVFGRFSSKQMKQLIIMRIRRQDQCYQVYKAQMTAVGGEILLRLLGTIFQILFHSIHYLLGESQNRHSFSWNEQNEHFFSFQNGFSRSSTLIRTIIGNVEPSGWPLGLSLKQNRMMIGCSALSAAPMFYM